MGNHSCTLYNDTEYDVVVVNYDGTTRMPPGDRYYPWLLKGGNYYLKIIMEFPGVWEEGVVYLYAHEFEDRTHRMSTMFNKQITEYQKKSHTRKYQGDSSLFQVAIPAETSWWVRTAIGNTEN